MSKAPPARKLFTDPSTRVVWAAICELEEGDQHEVLEHLRERLLAADIRETPSEQRVARAVAALREAASELGHSPAVGEYRKLRVDHPEWPPDGSVRTWCGGTWNQALERARLDAVRVGDSLASDNPRLTRNDLIAAVKEAAGDLSGDAAGDVVPSLTAYLSWARRPDVRRRPGRRPRSQSPFDREFGGYRGALAAARLVGDGQRSSRSGYRYTDEELFAALDEIVERLVDPHDHDDRHRDRDRLHEVMDQPDEGQDEVDDDGDQQPFPTIGQYNQLRAAILEEEALAEKPPRAFPGPGVLQRRWRHWPKVEWHYRQRGER